MAISVTSPCPEGIVGKLGIKNWSIWTCEASSCDWAYYHKETSLLLEGQVSLTPAGGEPVEFGEGDLVVFPLGIEFSCDVHKYSPQTLSFCVLK